MLLDNAKDKHDGMIKCISCGRILPIEEFYQSATKGKLYISTKCRDCKRKSVRDSYYLRKFGKHDKDASETHKNRKRGKSDAQHEFFKVENKIVYALLCWYSVELKQFKHEFVPVMKYPTKIQCYALASRLRFKKAGYIKQLASEYRKKHGVSNYIE